MVGFRNVAIHDYQKLSLAIVQRIIPLPRAQPHRTCHVPPWSFVFWA